MSVICSLVEVDEDQIPDLLADPSSRKRKMKTEARSFIFRNMASLPLKKFVFIRG